MNTSPSLYNSTLRFYLDQTQLYTNHLSLITQNQHLINILEHHNITCIWISYDDRITCTVNNPDTIRQLRTTLGPWKRGHKYASDHNIICIPLKFTDHPLTIEYHTAGPKPHHQCQIIPKTHTTYTLVCPTTTP